MTTAKRKSPGRPRRGKRIRETISLRLDPALVKKVDADAKRLGETRTEYIERAISDRVGQKMDDGGLSGRDDSKTR